MSKSTHQFEVKGVDKSAGAFSSIKGRAAATAAQIRSMVGGAIAAAGAYMSFRAIKGGIDELGHLSDIAQKTSTSVDELTQTAAALNVLGIQNMGIDQLGKAFDYLQKTTGRTGMGGFLQTIEELGKIEDVAKRGQEAMRIFGRSGMEFMPLINGANHGIGALENVINAMPKVPQSAAEAGDDAADAMAIFSNEIHSLWLQGIVAVGKLFTDDMVEDARTGALNACSWMEYWAKNTADIFKMTWNNVKSWTNGLGGVVGAAVAGVFKHGYHVGEIWKDIKEAWNWNMDEADRHNEDIVKRIESRAQHLAIRLSNNAKFSRSYGKAALGRYDITDNGSGLNKDIKSQTRISNDLIMGGSNAATRLQLLGPTLQSEQKITNELLEKVVENTAKTANNTDNKSGDELHTLDS